MRALRCGAFLLGILSFTPAVQVQAQPAPKAYKFHLETRLATADALVRDNRTKSPVDGLHVADFKVFDNSRELPITHFSVDKRPLAVVLLLDLWWGYARQVREVLPESTRRIVSQFQPWTLQLGPKHLRYAPASSP